jgi:hypothetical protein
MIVGVLVLILLTLIPRLSWAEGFLYLPITRTPVITAGFCGYRTASGACHGGIDYDVRDDGDGIIAAAEGVVEATSDGWSNTRRDNIVSYGNSVRVRHPNGYLTIYGHLKSGTLQVRVGDHVRIGSPLGVGDNSGWSTGSHLHFEVRDPGNRKVDPYGESPSYPNCGANPLWVNCPPLSPDDVDRDGDGYNLLVDCDDGNRNIHPGATEFCNGVDENCDTIPDDRWAALGTACSVTPLPGCERSGTYECSPDETTIVCNADPTVGAERCNGIDDDCDGGTDEDWRTGLTTDLGEPCAVGEGECYRTGVWECEPGGRGVVCGAEYVYGTEEICDGLDNDCDSETDNFCRCRIASPHPNCLCHECDASCPPSEICLAVGFNPDGSVIHTCAGNGCYGCTVSCINDYCLNAPMEYCVSSAYSFCGSYCPSW